MAIEDIIWAKNRHMFGGIAPSNMLKFTATVSSTDKTQVSIAATPPTKTVIDGQTVCTMEGVVIRKSAAGYPKDEFDGDLVIDKKGTSSFTHVDTIEENQPVYYAAFPYSKQGIYNRNTKNRTTINVSSVSGAGYYFGYDLDTTNPDPEARVTYPTGVDNADYEPAVLNDLKDWNITPGEKFMPRPVMLAFDGSVEQYLDPNDYNKQLNSSEESRITNGTNTTANAMMQWPKIYTKRWEENGIYHFRCSDIIPNGETQGNELGQWQCWCNFDGNNNEIDHFYTAIYRSYPISNMDRSLSLNGSVVNTSFVDSRPYAQANGDGWDIEYLSDWLLIQDLLVMMGKTTNTQAAFGVGTYEDSLDHYKSAGSLNQAGLFYGSTDPDRIKVFGMEDYWGEYHRQLLGLFSYQGAYYVKITKGIKDGTTVTDFSSNSGSGYLQLSGLSSSSNATSGSAYYSGYLDAMTCESWGRLPSALISGSDSTYECDYCYIAKNAGKYTPVAVGGSYNDANAYRGAFRYVAQLAYDGTGSTYTRRLSYKPTKQ